MDQEEAPSRFDGEDTSPTTDRELKGWYSIGLAAEIFAVCGVGSFAPVTLEQLAREHGVLKSDNWTPCVYPPPQENEPILVRLTRRVADNVKEGDQCVVKPFGWAMSTASFALYTFSFAVFLQALVLITFSPVADYGTRRKRLLLVFAFTGAIATMLYAFVVPQVYLLGSLLTIVGVICLGCTFVLLNSFLPLLAARHPNVDDKSTTALAMSVRISSKGVGLGYAAAVLAQVISIGLLTALKRAHFAYESTSLRSVLFFAGLCWTALTIPGALWLTDRPGPPLPASALRKSRLPKPVHYLIFAWSSVYRTVRTALKLHQTALFLVAWFLLSDAIATVSGTAILFARTELHMGTIEIACLSILVTVSGIAGALLWPRLSALFRLQPKAVIVACMCLMEVIPLYGLIGFLPFVQHWGVGGLQRSWEIYPLGVIHGLVMGGLNSYCRAFYGEMIPPGSEAAFYALYAITDKGSSAVGPALVGVIVDRVGSIRPAFAFLAFLIAMPIPLIWWVDVGRGRQGAMAWAERTRKGVGHEMPMSDFSGRGDELAAEGLLASEDDVDVRR
ncbi:hypothetical protein B0A48_10938 [Cryoendolithus antarcticus]|uniref:Autophagy-related protein n=1 Tax=Cryoendolithus antarcticus TaxID=1507870 RepID=A0A1V8SYT9_9PEZI|nr:hypothetical protein B0A48_10938 [Cryoendolithus antarcticus]